MMALDSMHIEFIIIQGDIHKGGKKKVGLHEIKCTAHVNDCTAEECKFSGAVQTMANLLVKEA